MLQTFWGIYKILFLLSTISFHHLCIDLIIREPSARSARRRSAGSEVVWGERAQAEGHRDSISLILVGNQILSSFWLP